MPFCVTNGTMDWVKLRSSAQMHWTGHDCDTWPKVVQIMHAFLKCAYSNVDASQQCSLVACEIQWHSVPTRMHAQFTALERKFIFKLNHARKGAWTVRIGLKFLTTTDHTHQDPQMYNNLKSNHWSLLIEIEKRKKKKTECDWVRIQAILLSISDKTVRP